MSETLKEKTAKGLFWGGLSNGLQQLLGLLFGIFLARILSQDDYGMVGMLAIFSAVAGALQDGGFIAALNRKKSVSHKDYNAVFWTSSLLGISFYVILFFSAPLIARFYGVPELVPLARYIFLGLIFSSLGIVPSAYIFRNMMVRESAIISLTALTISGAVGVLMAIYGFAYWGIATQTILYIFLVTSMRFYFSKWRPTLPVDFSPIKELFGFGSKLVVTNIFNVVSNNIFSVLLGKMYNAREVGNYVQAYKWNNMGSSFISNMLNNIAQPVFAKTTDEKERQKNIFRKLLRFTAFVSFPVMLGLALVSKEFIVILLTEKWLESAKMMQMLCIAGAFLPISNLFSHLLVGRGHSTTFMWCSIALCLILLSAVLLSSPWGIYRMIQVYVVINISWLFVWYFFARNEIDLKLHEVLKDISPYLLLTLGALLAAHLLTASITNLYVSFALKIVIVVGLYVLALWLLQSVIFKEVVTFLVKRDVKE